MSSKTKRRAHGRPQERRRPAPPPPRTPRARPRPPEPPRADVRLTPGRSPRRVYAYAVGAALVTAAVLIALSQLSAHRGGTTPAPAPGASLAGVTTVSQMLAGVPQHGNVLGARLAPVQLIEYSEPQCPYCARFATLVLPALVPEYVRTGKLEIVFRGLAFLGPDSLPALRTIAAAGAQNRLWNTAEILFANQGPENAWLSDTILRSAAGAAGADVGRVFADRDGSAALAQIDLWARQAQADGVHGTPTFFLGRRGERPQRVSLASLTVTEFRTLIDGELAG